MTTRYMTVLSPNLTRRQPKFWFSRQCLVYNLIARDFAQLLILRSRLCQVLTFFSAMFLKFTFFITFVL